jgi:lysophospholipase L1-like esterase
MNPADPACLSFQPNARVRYTGIYKRIPPMTHKINQYGYRGEPRSPERKNHNAFRIVIVGDSMSFSPGLSDGDDYSSRLERQLKKETGMEIEVINLAIPGMNLEEVAAAMETRAMTYQPDAVLVQVCANDFNESLCAIWAEMGKAAGFAYRHCYLARIAITILLKFRKTPPVSLEEQSRRTEQFFTRLRAFGPELPIALVSFGLPGRCKNDCPIEKSCDYNIPHFPIPYYLQTQMTFDGCHLDKVNTRSYVQRLTPWLLENLERGCNATP